MRLAIVLLAALPLAARAETRVELSEGVDVLSGDRAGWRATALEAAWLPARATAVGGAVRELSRFSLADLDAALWAHAPLGGTVLGLEASASPTARFVPRFSAGVRAERALGGGWVTSAGLRALRYEGDLGRTTATVASLGLERYRGDWRAAATATAAGLEGDWGGGGRLALDRYYGDGGRAGVSASAGRELESVGGGALLRTDVLGAALSGAHPLARGWALTWEVSVARQGALYTRTGGRLGLRRSL